MTPSPFPGMNPYLEHPDRWSTVHNRLIVALADLLTPQLLPKYQVDIEKRVYEVVGVNSLLLGRPDVTVQRPRRAEPDGKAEGRAEGETEGLSTVIVSSTMSSPPQPVKVAVPVLEEVREAYLEVKEVATQLVITAIEILSPTNKRGDGRQKYEQKRQQVLNSQTHLVEIDLLREGEPLLLGGTEPRGDYRILVSRSHTRPMADLYPFKLRDPIPTFPVPLQPPDSEPTVDLKELVDQVYVRSGYDYFIDYQRDPLPPMSGADLAWLDAVLREQHLR